MYTWQISIRLGAERFLSPSARLTTSLFRGNDVSGARAAVPAMVDPSEGFLREGGRMIYQLRFAVGMLIATVVMGGWLCEQQASRIAELENSQDITFQYIRLLKTELLKNATPTGANSSTANATAVASLKPNALRTSTISGN